MSVEKNCPFIHAVVQHEISQKSAFIMGKCLGDKCALWTKGALPDGDVIEGCAFKTLPIMAAFIISQSR